jgi:hypothetical protein
VILLVVVVVVVVRWQRFPFSLTGANLRMQ